MLSQTHPRVTVSFTLDHSDDVTNQSVWRPGAPPPTCGSARSPGAPPPPPPPPPVWTPGSASASPLTPRKNFHPVHFEETPPARRKFGNLEQNGCTSGSESEGRLRTSQSAPVTGLSTLGGANVTSRLPKAQNPTVTLLQKAREGQLYRVSNSVQQERDAARLPRDRPFPPKGDPVHELRKEYASESEAERRDYERVGIRKMADANRKVEGIGPITRDGMPVALRSEVKDPSRWYKKMYDTIHKNKYDDDYVTIRYKSRRGQPPERVSSNKSQYAYFDPRSGYLSEPEGGLSRLGSSTWSDAYDSDVTTGPRRRTASVQEERRYSEASSPYTPSNNKYSTLASARASQEVYKNQPGRIENYVPGRSSVIDKESKQWWDEVMDIFDGQNVSSTTSLPQASPKDKKDLTATILSKSNMARALKESGYESDSTLVFRRREDTDGPLSPAERRAAYRDLQAGGEPPLRGFRSPAPPRQDESEIEYIPISSTLTKIRVHKKTPKVHEVICYPITRIETEEQAKFKKLLPSFLSIDVTSNVSDYPPAPPRRISSKNSRTLKFVTSTRPVSSSPKRTAVSHSRSNVDFLKDKINLKLSRQNTQILSKGNQSATDKKPVVDQKMVRSRIMSTSAPPTINKKCNQTITTKPLIKNASGDTKSTGTSSFGSSRRTLLPIEYTNTIHRKYGEPHSTVVIEGGAGRKTPISNILDKVTSLDKLWSAEKRNERIDLTKVRAKSLSKDSVSKPASTKPYTASNSKSISPTGTHKSRDMIRTAEKVQKLKISKLYTKSNPCLTTKSDLKNTKPLQSSSNISKSSLNISSNLKKQNQVRTAVVTNLKKKKSLESIVLRPRSVPCHESCSKKIKDNSKNTKKASRIKCNKKNVLKPSDESESGSQFGDTSCYDASNLSSSENLSTKRISTKDIKQSHDAVVSDSFFRHLFLGRTYTPITSCPISEPSTTVLQKAKLFQSHPQDNNSPKSLNTYLIHRKPVSMSRFKIWDSHISPTRVQSPRSISWPGRVHGEIRKFDSLSKRDEYGSTSSLATVRTRSEPPCNKIYFSQTSRPKSPTVLFYKKEKPKETQVRSFISPNRLVFNQSQRSVSPKLLSGKQELLSQPKQKSSSPSKLIFTETVRPISPVILRHSPSLEVMELQSSNEKYPSTMFFSQTSRPVSPKVTKKNASVSRSHSTSPIPIRSPSYRRIHNARLQGNRQYADTIPKSIFRTRSAGDAERKMLNNNSPMQTKSESNLHTGDPDYDEYVRDMQNTKVRSERFRELNRYYVYLERVAELEKTTSTSDLHHRKKDEEIIDFDRWKKIRAIERAEEELNHLYHKLKIAQSENDVLFYPRDLKDFRWSHDADRGLRIKERSVEDLKDHFQQITHYDSLELDQASSKDTYKPLWRGTSVAETAFYINKKNDNAVSKQRITIKPTVTLHHDSSLNDLRKKIGLGSRLWSSLSMEQVNALKNQLNAIYSKELQKSNKESDKYTIDVKNDKTETNSTLHVRCNSLITSDYISDKEKPGKLAKSDSIAAISCPITSVKELKNNVNKIQMNLSENEKRKISQTLSKEILDRINKFDTQTPLSLKEEIENIEIKDQISEDIKDTVLPLNNTLAKAVTDSSIDDKPGHVIYSIEKVETPFQSSASETETASSDISNKTVIYRGPKKEVQKKVQYFESVEKNSGQTKTIYHARENSNESENQKQPNSDTTIVLKDIQSKYSQIKSTEPQKNQIVQSQSCTNFKELFGESEKNKFLSLPSKPDLYSRSTSPHSEVYIADRRTPDTLHCSSDETIWRSRSPSPDPERYWRAYLNLARAGEVRRLARRFDSPSATGAVLRRYRSDPEIARNAFSAFEKHTSRRDKCKVLLPVARVPLRPTNRFMPHIDIISKLAALRRRTTPRSRSAEEALECRPGEVGRIRRRFETMSLLGQIYSSAPDVSELHDIAPYLAGSWIAHRYPKCSDNNRSAENPNMLVREQTSPVKKEIKKITPKESIKLSSILKGDTFANQEFNPEAHRPASRYEPPRAPPRPPPASWPQRLSPYVTPSKHTCSINHVSEVSNGESVKNILSKKVIMKSVINRNSDIPIREDIIYEDDEMFNDVPSAGSLSKSLIALNKYVKKNMLYDESEEFDNDSAFFSKESSPNESRTKYDSDSVKSTESIEGDQSSIDNSGAPISYSLTSVTQLTDDYKSMQLQEKSFNNSNKDIDTTVHNLHNQNTTEPVTKSNTSQSLSTFEPDHTSASLTNLSNIVESVQENDDQVVLRNKSSENKKAQHRHTLHEFTEWGNRTNIYPDVYAPLPYKSPRRYVESDVNIHYRCPVRHDPLPLVPERELARQQAEHMKRLYREQKRNKYLQENNIHPEDIEAFDTSMKELQDMQNRRHQDNFTPSQKNIIPMNRYDEAEKVIAKALYTFSGQTSRELSFRKGEMIHVRRQIDANWYEGELHGRIGLFPYNYVEIQKGDTLPTAKKPAVVEGRARAKFDFIAQTNLELPLKKGEIVVLTRRIDQNWWEGRNSNKTGIFPDSYVTILQEPSPNKPGPQSILSSDKPVASPAAHGLLNGSAKRSMGSHSYTPQQNSPALSNAPPSTQPLPGYVAKPAQATLSASERGYGPPSGAGVDLNNTEPLYVDTNAEAVPFRAMYKYRPQNPDELELNEGDTVYVLEKCDDGWYVGSSQRTGRFGTFPGNYVERI
ncbi:unnamed protein product [Arctia plantaginis]|uniref:SoHo domain-containing protein n=1 Tax=Arctia plantaginis TaxID=874455 RepID=A0A8S1A3A6_ARCPL|nr:unnamed protein product [Arctia plantaginis]